MNPLPSELEPGAVQVSYPESGVAVVQIQSKPLGVLRFGVKQALLGALQELEQDAQVRCVVLTGVEQAFSVGSDIRDFRQDVGWLLENDYLEAGLNAAIEASPLPVIAACNGYTLGGGAVLALACDFRTAARAAKFGFPEVKVGAFASGSGTQRLPRLVGRGRALELLLTGRTIEAEEALRIGLVEFVFDDEALLTATVALAAQIASYPAGVTAATKACVHTGLREGWQAGLAKEQELRVRTGTGPEAAEGREAFLEKRPPRFHEGGE